MDGDDSSQRPSVGPGPPRPGPVTVLMPPPIMPQAAPTPSYWLSRMDAVAWLKPYAEKLIAAGGPLDPKRFGPRVEKVFEKLLKR